jgi:TRAP-type C4-dicarboxylate transport system permease small subunit
MKRLYALFCKAEETLCAICFIALVTVVFTAVIMRGFHVSFSWNMDIALLLLAWSSFLGADCAFRGGQLVGIDLFIRGFSKRNKVIIEIIVLFVILFVLIFITFFGIKLTITDWMRQYNSIPVSFSWAVMSLPVAAFSMIITDLLKIRDRFATLKNKEIV